MDFISLFAGQGGFDIGLERAGMRCVAQVEIDPFEQKILRKHWPNTLLYGDIRDVGINRKHQLPAADLICGGFPCQPHSTAGKRRGAADDRNLWPEYRRLVAEYNPAWVFAENVLGIRTTILDQVLSDLEGLDYSAIPFVVPACAFNAPHIRRRIFIIAHANRFERDIPVSTAQQEKELHTGRFGETRNASHSISQGLQEREIQRQNQTEKGAAESYRLGSYGQTEGGKPQPGVCGVDDGISNWLDRGQGLNGYWDEWTTVSPLVGKIPFRDQRVSSCGNAVVPQIIEWFGRMILRVSE